MHLNSLLVFPSCIARSCIVICGHAWKKLEIIDLAVEEGEKHIWMISHFKKAFCALEADRLAAAIIL